MMSGIAAWLEGLGLGKYIETFAENEIDFDVLPELTEPDLERMAIPLGPRKKLLKAIAKLTSASRGAVDSAASGAADWPPTAPRTYTPRHLSERILNSRSALEGERKQVTVLFADIKGSTELIDKLDPEQANRLLDPVLRAMMDAVHRFEGTVNKIQGDGLMALFGAPLAHEDHAVRACYAALAMQHAVKNLAEEHTRAGREAVHIRVGLHSGEVVVRNINSDLSMHYDAVGMTVNLAARVEQCTPPGAVYLSAETERLTRGLIDVESQGPTPMKGVNEPVEVYRLLGTKAARTRWQATLARGLGHFVARETPMRALSEALERAGKGYGRLVALVGEPGVGKSRLIYEFTRAPLMRGWQILAGSSVSYGKASNWLPVIDLCKSYFGIDEGDDPAGIAAKIRTRLDTLDASFTAHAAVFLALLELPVEEPAWRALGAKQQRRRTLDTLQALFVRESQRQPLLLIFEDLHWTDGETQTLLDELTERLPGNRILLLVDYRPDYDYDWSHRSAYLRLRLDPLASADAEALLDKRLGTDKRLRHLKSRLVERCAGNPLFLEECVRALVETGTIAGQTGAYQPARELDELALPSTLQALIAERIDRLTPAGKELLQTAAVIGSNLSLAVLRAVAEKTDDELRRELSELQAAEFLFPVQLFPEFEYCFKHAHTQQVAYAELLHEQRRRLHARAAEAMAALYPQRRSELAEILAEHYEKGEIWNRAIEHYLLAAAKGKSKYTYASASNYAQKALALAEKLPVRGEAQTTALTLLGDLASLMGDLNPANDYYERALKLASAGERRRRIADRVHRRNQARRGGAKIAFYEHGSGEQTLLLVRAVAYHVAMFQPVVEMLCQDFRVVTIDPRGTGASAPVPKKYSPQQYMEDIRAVIEKLACGAVVAIGISAGGQHVAWLAHRYPELVAKLVFVGTPHAPDFDGPEWRHRWRALADGDFSRFDEFIAAFAQSLFPEPEARDFAEDYIRGAKQLPQEVWRNFSAHVKEDIRSLLGGLRIPTLVLHGAIDRRVPFDCARDIARRVPGAQLYPFAGKGHHIMFTASQEFCEVLGRFVRTGTVPSASRGSDTSPSEA